jgi:hypothetical protein
MSVQIVIQVQVKMAISGASAAAVEGSSGLSGSHPEQHIATDETQGRADVKAMVAVLRGQNFNLLLPTERIRFA